MSHFRKKPVEIEARAFVSGQFASVAEWCNGRVVKRGGAGNTVAYLLIPTLGGSRACQIGDWVIRDAHGEFYPCKPDIFAATHEPVD